MIDKNIFVARLLTLIGERKPSAFAKDVGCDPKTIYNAVNDGKIPGIDILEKITGGRVAIGWLLGETDEMTLENGKKWDPLPEDPFDLALDTFFEKVKIWLASENGRTMETAMDFTQKFPLRFPEYVKWLKNSSLFPVQPD